MFFNQISSSPRSVLKVLFAQQKDSGVYECQISTAPPVGFLVMFSVVGKGAIRVDNLKKVSIFEKAKEEERKPRLCSGVQISIIESLHTSKN